jgi:hypothetical protein
MTSKLVKICCGPVALFAMLVALVGCGGMDPYVPAPKPRPNLPAMAQTTTPPEPIPVASPRPKPPEQPSQPASSCATDACFRREVNADGICAVVQAFGRAVYEKNDGGWGYDFVQTAGATLAFRVIAEDHPLHLLHAPAVEVKMLSEDPYESSTCNWCLCATDCAFRQTGVIISTSRDRLPGTVQLLRFGDGGKAQRESTSPSLPGWQPSPQFHGYVCPPAPPA